MLQTTTYTWARIIIVRHYEHSLLMTDATLLPGQPPPASAETGSCPLIGGAAVTHSALIGQGTTAWRQLGSGHLSHVPEYCLVCLVSQYWSM